jgi:hypothetical protein
MEHLAECPGSGSGERVSGADLIGAERLRQVEAEGWSAEHDSGHQEAELAGAAASYIAFYLSQQGCPSHFVDWPWETKDWKPSEDPVRNLVKAGALIAAEIDRLRRSGTP